MKISIITASFNSAATIAHAMESVLAQTYQDIEYCVVDGGSTDHTLQLIKAYEPKFNGRLRFVSEKDEGIYDAMNKGIRMATGEIVGILNSDDFFTSPTVIEEMVKAFTTEVDAIYGDVHFVNPDNLQKTVRYYSGKLFKSGMIKFGFMPPHPSFYVRRSLLETYGSFDPSYKIGGDFELIARLCYVHKINAKYLHLDFVTMRMGGASTKDAGARISGLREYFRVCEKLGIKTNKLFISCKYFIKLYSSLFIRR